MLFSTVAAPAPSFACLQSFAVESTGPQLHQLVNLHSGAAAVPALPGPRGAPHTRATALPTSLSLHVGETSDPESVLCSPICKGG